MTARTPLPLGRASLTCLGLLDSARLRRWQLAFREAGIELTLLEASERSMANQLLIEREVAFVLAAADGSEASIDSAIGVRSVAMAPLVVTVDRPVDAQLQERLRLAGACMVVQGPPSVEAAQEIASRLGCSPDWLSSRRGQAMLPDILQIAASRSAETLVVVHPPEAPALAGLAWANMRPESPSEGWVGRVYLNQGQVIHAETPNRTGIRALAEMFRVRQPLIRIMEVFVSPLNPAPTGSVQASIINAAYAVDETERRRSLGLSTAPPPARIEGDFPWPEADFLEAEEKGVGEVALKLDGILEKVKPVQGIAACDQSGNTLALQGNIDAELTCAVAMMCQPEVDEIAALIGASLVTGWSLTQGRTSLLVVRGRGTESVVGIAEASRTPATLLRKLGEETASLRGG